MRQYLQLGLGYHVLVFQDRLQFFLESESLLMFPVSLQSFVSPVPVQISILLQPSNWS